MSHPYYDACADEYAALQAEFEAEKFYQRKLADHPNCEDKEHPGCKECREDSE